MTEGEIFPSIVSASRIWVFSMHAMIKSLKNADYLTPNRSFVQDHARAVKHEGYYLVQYQYLHQVVILESFPVLHWGG